MSGDWTVRDAVERYRADNRSSNLPAVSEQITLVGQRSTRAAARARGYLPPRLASRSAEANDTSRLPREFFMLGTLGEEVADSQPAAPALGEDGVPVGYWRENIWRQMGREGREFGTHDFWRGFKTSFWDVENALLLTATMGASVALRETGVDGTIRSRTHRSRQLGDADEPIQLLGHPGTHFAGAGVLWVSSTLMKDAKQHEVAKSLAQALAVNGVSTFALKAAANTRGPDGDDRAWPSGHTSSSFTVAAVLNEYYGPWAGIPSFTLAGLVGYQRIDSRSHDFSDVVFGAMLGTVIGTSIARDEKAQFPELWGLQVVPFTDPETGASGLALMKSW